MTSPAVFCLSVQLRPNNSTSHQTTKKHDTLNQRSQTSSASLRALPIQQSDPTSGIQTVAGDQTTNNHIIFLRGIRSDNGKIILTRDDNIRIQDGVLTVTNLNKTTNEPTNATLVDRNDNDNTSDVIIPTASGGRRVNGTPVLFYTSTGTAVTGSSDLTNGNVAFITNDELQVTSDFGDSAVHGLKSESEVETKAVSTPLGSVRLAARRTSVAGFGRHQPHAGQPATLLYQQHGLATYARHLPTHHHQAVPLNANGEPIKLPENLESLPKADHFPVQRHRWNTNEEIAAILISFERHSEWQSKEVRIRPKSGSMLLYSRKKVRYRRDGYCWKKRKDGKTTREDHMKLKVQGTECIYGCYVHSAILPTFHRRCYWLLQNPDIVLVHYLNVPYPDDNKLSCITPSLALWADKKEWTKEELVSQLKPMFFSEDEPDINNELEISTAETVEAIVTQLMEKQRAARQAALVKQLECGCPDSTCSATDGKQCAHPMRRIRGAATTGLETSNAVVPGKTGAREDSNQVSSTTGSGGMLLSNSHPRIYNRDRHHHSSSTANMTHQQHSAASSGNTPPLVLSLSQLQGGGGLLILNSNGAVTSAQQPVQVTSFVCSPAGQRTGTAKKQQHVVLKQEAMDTNSSCLHSRDVVNKMDVTNGNVTELYEGLTFTNPDKHLHHSSNNEIITLSSHSTPSKRMDTSEDLHHSETFNNACEQSVILLSSNSSKNRSNSNRNPNNDNPSGGSSAGNNSFFNETLDLSHEDIQRTLSANMPMCSGEEPQGHSASRNNVGGGFKNTKHVDEVHEQGVIVPEMNPMDFMDGADIVVSPTHVVDDDVFVNLDAFDMLGDFPELEVLEAGDGSSGGLLNVDKRATDQASPHMDYREGTANITDYSPEWAYPEGGVKVLVTGPWYSTTSPYTVLFDTFPVPTTLVQSGVLRCYCPAHEAGLATLQVACEGFVISNSVMFEYKLPPHEDTSSTASETKLERSTTGDSLLRFTLLHRLEAMDERLQIKQEPDTGSDGVEDSVLLQNPAFEERLVNYCQTLTARQWRHSTDESIAAQQLIGLRGMTLLHLSASLGYTKLVATMLQWRSENSSLVLDTEVDALSQDEDGFTPLMWACARGHTETAIMLYRWNHTALNVRNAVSQTALECARANQHQSLARELEHLEYCREQPLSLDVTMCSPQAVSPASSVGSVASTISISKSHDGVFLRPGAVNSINNSISSLSRLSTNSSNMFNFGSGDSYSSKNSGQKLMKRPSVDSGINLGTSSDSLSSLRSRTSKTGRDIPKLSRFDRSMSLPLNSPLSGADNSYDGTSPDFTNKLSSKRMEYTLSEAPRCESPYVDVEALSDDDADEKQQNVVGEQEVRVLTLAEQIIAAMPDRIKNEIEEMQLDNSPKPSDSLGTGDNLSDVFMEPLLDQSSSSFDNTEFNFEFSDHNYRYYDVGTPSSSLSPASSSCLQSPCSFTLDSPSPPPTTADFCEFFQASGNVFEKDFSNLTLSDKEQRELYEAAKIIQKAYRSYKGRQCPPPLAPPQEQPDKERAAAVLIQNYYRRYKQYAYFKQMTRAAMVIQSGYRSYCEHKRFKKSQEAAVCIQNYYRNYREQGGRGSREGTPASCGLKRTYSQRRQHQAARKIQQFMRQSKNKLQKERAEKERQEVPPQSAAQAKSPCRAPNFSAAEPPRRPPCPVRNTSSVGSDTADSGRKGINEYDKIEMDINH